MTSSGHVARNSSVWSDLINQAARVFLSTAGKLIYINLLTVYCLFITYPIFIIIYQRL